MPHRTQPPCLPTLHTKPSWHNRAGRVDRSACLDVRVNELWRLARFQPATYEIQRKYRHLVPTPKTPGRCPPQLDAVAQYNLERYHLEDALDRPRRPLAGDDRSARANAMNPHAADPKHKPRFQSPDDLYPPNPNQGDGASKILALPDKWSQTVPLQRWWQYPDFIRHYLLCPTCGRRVRTLFLVLCTNPEFTDASIARTWLRFFALRHPNAPGLPIEAQIHQRYHLILPPRRLQCRHCLGLRYGEVKPKTRQRLNDLLN